MDEGGQEVSRSKFDNPGYDGLSELWLLYEIQIPGDEGSVWGARDVHGKAWIMASLDMKKWDLNSMHDAQT